MSIVNNLALTATSSAMSSSIGFMYNLVQSKLANGGRDSNCKFYYNESGGGSILIAMGKTVARGVVGGVVSELKDLAENEFNSLLFGKNKEGSKAVGEKWCEAGKKKREADVNKYGKMAVNGGDNVVYAVDDWGGVATEALMLGVKVYPTVRVNQVFERPSKKDGRTISDPFDSDTLVWYDTTALINLDSERNIIVTKVQGRDYSRKELVSNGDIRFSVTGQITSSIPDIYPAEEVKKFYKVMQYKGVVEVNNQILNELGITNIIVTNFSLSSREGYKAVQQYSFSAIGLQPESEMVIKEDTVEVFQHDSSVPIVDDDSAWVQMLKNQLDGLKSMSSDLFSQGLGLVGGMLENVI